MSTILVAEPNSYVRKLVKTILERNGHTVCAFNSSEKALCFLKAHSRNVLTKALVPKPDEPCDFLEHQRKNSAIECPIKAVILDTASFPLPIQVIVAKIQLHYPDVATIVTCAGDFQPMKEVPVQLLVKPYDIDKLVLAVNSSISN